MRISALPTCWANVLTAFWLCGGTDRYDLLAMLLFVSSCFYLGGMVLNDVCDAKLDAVERPERPIPSGQIALPRAALVSKVFLIQGASFAVALGVFVKSEAAIVAGLALLACVLSYNFFLKRIPIIGPVTMGLCRFFNILMVSFAVGGGVSVYAVSVSVYITSVTILSGYEAKSLFVRKLVGKGLAAIILIDAVWCFAFVGIVPALTVLALYPLAMALRRVVSMT